MKQNVSETESNRRFRKNVKTCLQNKESKHGHFRPVLILPVKMLELPQQRATTTVHYGCKHYHYQLLQKSPS